MKKHIPNLFTLLNLFSGCCGIIAALNSAYDLVPFFVIISLIADFADGLVARALGVSSELGMQLDSLADGVTFGVLPGLLIYTMMTFGDIIDYQYIDTWFNRNIIALIIPLAAVYRLGKFNIDTRQSDSFLGLATPAAAIYLIGLYLIYRYDTLGMASIVGSDIFLIINSILVSLLMISEIPMFSFKLKNKGLKGNEVQLIFVVVCLILFTFFKWGAPAFIILVYVLFSIIGNTFQKDQSLIS